MHFLLVITFVSSCFLFLFFLRQASIATRELLEAETAEVERDLAELDVSVDPVFLYVFVFQLEKSFSGGCCRVF